MIDPDSFEMIERVSRQALERHPAWAPFESADDRERILDWGVDAKHLDDEIARFEFCGPSALYPVLQLDPLPPLRHLIIAVDYESDAGVRCSGYWFEPNAHGLFVGDREFCLNRSLAELSGRVATRFAAALDTTVAELFPLRYRSSFATSGDAQTRGSLERFW